MRWREVRKASPFIWPLGATKDHWTIDKSTSPPKTKSHRPRTAVNDECAANRAGGAQIPVHAGDGLQSSEPHF